MELAPDDKQHSESSFIQRQTEVILILSMNSFYGKNIAELKDIRQLCFKLSQVADEKWIEK